MRDEEIDLLWEEILKIEKALEKTDTTKSKVSKTFIHGLFKNALF